MSVRIYSTLTGREDKLVPVDPDGPVRMYVCGMTPKFHPHVGHARLFVSMDVIVRYLNFRGFQVKLVQNFTDIDDKIIERAANENREADATAQAYMDSYFEVMDRLGVRRADDYPTVTAYMERIIEFIAALVESKHAYAVDTGDVYFEVSSFADYGKLSHRDLNSQLVAARKELEPGKRDPRDFALWKRARAGEPSWPSPWGRGRPGWHIECSAMVRETLGDQIEIHGGGADLIFPHHENEIAQTESLTGKVPFARHWVHEGLLVLSGGEKMAHSLENFTTLASILERYDPLEVRYFLLATHYRSSLAFTVEGEDAGGASVRGIEDARNALGRLRRALGPEPLDTRGPVDQPSVDAFTAAMDADFNTPDALAVIFDLAREINTLRASQGIPGPGDNMRTLRRTAGSPDAPAPMREPDYQGSPSQELLDCKRRTLVELLDVLGLDLRSSESSDQRSIGPFVELLLETRRKLRGVKQWALADEIRDRLIDLGVTVSDVPGGGSTWSIER
jgi:cysteinyl-tRNA synthetase